MDLINFDVFGLIRIPSISKDLYYVSLINHYSRITWVHFLKVKYEIFSLFMEFKAFFENYTSRKIKVSRTNNGSDFCHIEFHMFHKKNGAKIHRKSWHILLNRVKLRNI